MKIISEQEYVEACECNQGYCTNCQDFTNDCVEPDARHYKCDECGMKTVYGTEEALLEGLISFK